MTCPGEIDSAHAQQGHLLKEVKQDVQNNCRLIVIPPVMDPLPFLGRPESSSNVATWSMRILVYRSVSGRMRISARRLPVSVGHSVSAPASGPLLSGSAFRSINGSLGSGDAESSSRVPCQLPRAARP
jgi:hypothetical protein